ncbi:disintegrin and metalloproteinase domain-containing protein 26A-like [Sigmodon hispidus]
MSLQLCLWILLLLSAWSPMGHAKYSSPPEVVIPLRVIDPTIHDIYPDWLSYSLRFGGERHIITMKPTKSFISRNFLLLTYTDQGDRIEEQPFVQNDCYYHGNVDEDPESLVSINTCFGTLQGMLVIHGTSYEIMPKNQTSTFEHLIYKMDIKDTESFSSMRCGLTEDEIARQKNSQESEDSTLMQSSYEGWWTHHKYLEYYVAVDNKRFVYTNNNVTKCIQDVLEIVSAINVLYVQIDTEVIVTTLEIWTQTNHINVTNGIGAVLGAFCSWKKKNVDRRFRNDVAHLFARQGYGIYLGLAYLATVCTSNGCGVMSFMSDSVSHMASVIAHELGHNLGMNHDMSYCTCGLKDCIMAAVKSSSPKFSNCSYRDMFPHIRRACLQNNPLIRVKLNTSSSCGNNLVEEGEQCDCGSSRSCQRDPCCNEFCVFKPGAECSLGLCCNKCKLRTTGTVCRQKKNECDLPEWCNGTSAECPRDVYIEDGSPCGVNGYCYNLSCHNREEHCQEIFGKSARSADNTCYMEMNKRGDRFGNCGNDSISYKKCDKNDVLCGRIQCENVEEIPQRKNHETVHWTQINNVTCWSMDYHFGITLEDSGVVRDGTSCGPNNICVNKKCVANPQLLNNCSFSKCNMNGVCNNNGNCHCDNKWEPPDCLLSGFGGSVDSGPPPIKIPKKSLNRNSLMAILLMSLFLVMLLIVVIIIVKKKFHHRLQLENDNH